MTSVIIIGAGAAGLMCAATAAARGRSVTVLEHQGQPGRKILVSGGGRCNFTNLEVGPGNYLSSNPHFAKSALARYSPYDFMQMMTRHHLTWNEKTLGQLFCDQRAEAVLKMLQRECRDHKVDIRTGVRVEGVSASPDGGFDVSLGKKSMHADAVVIACGGLSLPKIGATSLGFKVADSFGLTVVPPRAGLVPFVFTEACRALWSPLAGLSTPATVSCGGVSFSEAVLFTHKGLSGPAILQASSYWQNGEPVVIDLLPGIDAGEMLINAKLKTPKLAVKSVLAKHFPKRLAERLCQVLKAEGTLITLSDKALKQVGEGINRWTIVPQSTEGYRTAEVTVGGVDTAELSSKTMETKRVPGLYFIGEVVDVTGWLGGYNFQWSWASGSAAGEAV